MLELRRKTSSSFPFFPSTFPGQPEESGNRCLHEARGQSVCDWPLCRSRVKMLSWLYLTLETKTLLPAWVWLHRVEPGVCAVGGQESLLKEMGYFQALGLNPVLPFWSPFPLPTIVSLSGGPGPTGTQRREGEEEKERKRQDQEGGGDRDLSSSSN